MHYNPDFEGLKGLMILGTLCTCLSALSIYDFLTLPWDLLINTKDSYGFNAIQAGIGSIFITLLLLLPALYTAAKKCKKRIESGMISYKQGILAYAETVFFYLIIGLGLCGAVIIFGTPVLEFRRALVPLAP